MTFLAADWKDVLLKAWSIRFITLAGLVQLLEEILPEMQVLLSPEMYQWATIIALVLAFIARMMPQANMGD